MLTFFHEILDISNKEQVSVTLHYVTCDYKINEMYMDFIEVKKAHY